MLPLALSLIEENRDLSDLLPKLSTAPTCIFYDTTDEFGKCSAYLNRPVICRLFGWAKVRGKNGPRMSLCVLLKDSKVEDLSTAPDLNQWSSVIQGLEPSLSELMPLNLALKKMLEKLLLEKQFTDCA